MRLEGKYNTMQNACQLTCQVKHIVHLGVLKIRKAQAKIVSRMESSAGSGVANTRLCNGQKIRRASSTASNGLAVVAQRVAGRADAEVLTDAATHNPSGSRYADSDAQRSLNRSRRWD